jgi:hypothetical protein
LGEKRGLNFPEDCPYAGRKQEHWEFVAQLIGTQFQDWFLAGAAAAIGTATSVATMGTQEGMSAVDAFRVI